VLRKEGPPGASRLLQGSLVPPCRSPAAPSPAMAGLPLSACWCPALPPHVFRRWTLVAAPQGTPCLRRAGCRTRESPPSPSGAAPPACWCCPMARCWYQTTPLMPCIASRTAASHEPLLCQTKPLGAPAALEHCGAGAAPRAKHLQCPQRGLQPAHRASQQQAVSLATVHLHRLTKPPIALPSQLCCTCASRRQAENHVKTCSPAVEISASHGATRRCLPSMYTG